jgi:hypothetical protein
VAGQGTSPSIASDGTSYLAVWLDSSTRNASARVLAAPISAAGVVGATVEVAAGFNVAPYVYYDGAHYVAAWVNADVQVVRLDATGTPIEPPHAMMALTAYGTSVALASDGTSTLVAWTGYPTAQSTSLDVFGRRYARDLTPIDSAPFVISSALGDQVFPAATWDGAQYLVTWQDLRESSTYIDADIYAARVTSAGMVLDPQGIPDARGMNNQLWPAVIDMQDGVADLIVWSEARRTDRFEDFDIFGAWIRKRDGVVLDPVGIPLSANNGNELKAALAPHGQASALLVYHRIEESPGYGNDRVRGRFIGSGALAGATCSAASDCATRACADGVCCDRPCDAACETCAAVKGTCTPVKNAEDPNSCAGDRTCDATGKCGTKNGRSCSAAGDCVSGNCADGICCDRACQGACETCAAPLGTCSLRAPRSAGSPACIPYACDGTNESCPTSCTSNLACPSGSHCDVPSGHCISGNYCIDIHTLATEAQTPTACAPYTCESNACRTTCRDVHDCVFPNVCSAVGECVNPPAPVAIASGCRAARGTTSDGYAVLGLLAGAALARRLRRRSSSAERSSAG